MSLPTAELENSPVDPDGPAPTAPPSTPRKAGVVDYVVLVLLGYLFFLAIELAALVIGLPAVVYFFPQYVAAGIMTVVMLFMLVAPHVYVRTKLQRQLVALAAQAGIPGVDREEESDDG